jgi:hypothetical protein
MTLKESLEAILREADEILAAVSRSKARVEEDTDTISARWTERKIVVIREAAASILNFFNNLG